MSDERLLPAAEAQIDTSTSQHPPALPVPAGGENRYARAGRLGAERIQQLINRGKRYEEEHGLTARRQRIRQLIEYGKQYEEEHGLAAPKRRPRQSRDEVWHNFVLALRHVVKPTYLPELERLVAASHEVASAPVLSRSPEIVKSDFGQTSLSS